MGVTALHIFRLPWMGSLPLVLPRHAGLRSPPRWTVHGLLPAQTHDPLLSPSALAATTLRPPWILPGGQVANPPRLLLLLSATCIFSSSSAANGTSLDSAMPRCPSFLHHHWNQARYSLSYILTIVYVAVSQNCHHHVFFCLIWIQSSCSWLWWWTRLASNLQVVIIYLVMMWDFRSFSPAWLVWFCVLTVCFFLTYVWTRLSVMDLADCYYRMHLVMFDLNVLTKLWIFGSSD
jgi:hypothetical protein